MATFFGSQNLPQPSICQVILVNENYPINGLPDKEDRCFFNLMNHTMKINPGEELVVGDFTVHLFEMLSYDEPDHVICSWKDISLLMWGSYVHAKTDVCVMTENVNIILLMQEDKIYREQVHPEVQLIAEVIATFQSNNMQLR
jgi:hypothetical protein